MSWTTVGVGKVIRINNGEREGQAWAIVTVVDQDYAGKDAATGKSKYRDDFASLMLRGKTAATLVKYVEVGKVVQFCGKPRAGKPYAKDGNPPTSSLEVEIDDFNGYWKFVPSETKSGGSASGAAPSNDPPAPTPPAEDTEDPDAADPFANMNPE